MVGQGLADVTRSASPRESGIAPIDFGGSSPIEAGLALGDHVHVDRRRLKEEQEITE